MGKSGFGMRTIACRFFFYLTGFPPSFALVLFHTIKSWRKGVCAVVPLIIAQSEKHRLGFRTSGPS